MDLDFSLYSLQRIQIVSVATSYRNREVYNITSKFKYSTLEFRKAQDISHDLSYSKQKAVNYC